MYDCICMYMSVNAVVVLPVSRVKRYSPGLSDLPSTVDVVLNCSTHFSRVSLSKPTTLTGHKYQMSL